MATVLETSRLLLREVEESDGSFILALLNSPGFLENIGDRGVRTEAAACDYIRDVIAASYRELGFGLWLVVRRGDARPVGIAGLIRRDGLDDPDVGYALAPDAWGQGYAQEAAAVVVDHALGTLGLTRLAAITTPENFASMAVLRKLGFAFEGMVHLPGSERESAYFTVAR